MIRPKYPYRLTGVCILIMCMLIMCMLLACSRQHEAASQEIETVTSGSLSAAAQGDAPKTLFVSVRDATGKMSALEGEARRSLASCGFNLVDSPSKAGYILQISLLSAGQAGREEMKNLVQAGYGTPARVDGRDTNGILADVLLVLRRVPEARRPSHARLKNITRRNAIGSAQMRLAVLGGSDAHSAVPAFTDTIARELGAALGHGSASRD